MVAQAINGALPQSMDMISSNNQSVTTSDPSDSFAISEKVSVATTLALLVGLVQVGYEKNEYKKRNCQFLRVSSSYFYRFFDSAFSLYI